MPAERDLSVEQFYEELIHSVSVAALGYEGISKFIESEYENSDLVMCESYLRSEHTISPRISFFDLSLM